ncbi:MAG: HAD hydrolase-like protein, partial [Candidatus Komeilibacteria bacterium]|nr:HAD hydrolase-like protein [Candidatus Komeilibacteria bacterium]
MIKAIIFDFDGVIHNTFPLHLRNLNKFVKNGDFSAEEYRALHDGNIHVMKKSLDKLKDINFLVYRDFIKDEFTAQKITADVNTALQKLNRDYQLFIISSGGEKIIN